jgi:NAD(P)-dependent dehydrogenase (short-subunit alcohol dehydrogenase family)
MTEADWDRMLAINAKAVFFLCQLALPSMIERQRGAIVNLASIAGKTASNQFLAHYSASKAAVIAITKTWARIVAPHGVRVNSVCPGIIDTPMWAKIDREMTARQGRDLGAAWADAVANVPMGRGAQPAEIGDVVVFLASDLAGYMTGQAINVSGGVVTY